MTASVPSGFSRDDLEKLLASAPTEETQKRTDSDEPRFGKQQLTEAELLEAAQYITQEALDRCNDPLFYKAIMLTIASRMIEWHMTVSEDQDTTNSRDSWIRDAGKFQAVMDIILNIQLGPDDPFLK